MDATHNQAAQPPVLRMAKKTILFLAANPLGTDRRALDQEARAIQDELERSGHRQQFELVTRWAARPLDLLRELRKLRPSIVHFSGLGGTSEFPADATPPRDIVGELRTVSGDKCHGLYFESTNGALQLVTTAALEETFGAAGSSVKLVVLNACYSEVQAEALLMHVDCVVGIAGSIRDDVARTFAIGFYGGLGERESVAAAYKQGCAAISLEGLPEAERPQLKVRGSIDTVGWAQRSTTYASENVNQAPLSQRIVHITIVLDTTREKVEAHIGRITSELRRLSGDVTMIITDLEEGSVRLKLALSPEGARRLVEMRQNSQLAQLCEFNVSAVQELGAIAPSTNRDFGVIIGIEDYPYFRSVRGAAKDARNFCDWLCDPDGGGLDQKNVTLILSDLQTKTPVQDEIDQALVNLLKNARARGGARRFYFYFSGHGATSYGQVGDDIALLLARWSTELVRLALSARGYASKLSQTGLFEEMVIFLDCCKSTSAQVIGMEPQFVLEWQKGPYATKTFIAYSTDDGMPVFEKSESAQWEGLFTKCLLSTLRSESGVVANELVERVRHRMATERPRGLSHPTVHASGSLDSAISFGSIPPIHPILEVRFIQRRGRVVLRSGKLQNGELPVVAEHVADETPWRLRLPVGLYLLEGEGESPVALRHDGRATHEV
jgi:hypothetical protein